MSLYSIKMRGSKEIEGLNKHISGAENIVKEEDLERVSAMLIKRALNHQNGKSESINIKIEKIRESDIKYLNPLEVTTIKVDDYISGLKAMKKLLTLLNIEEKKGEILINMLSSIKNMRGAILLDVHSLERLDNKDSRGIRVTYMDLENKDINALTKSEKYNSHFIEAIVLASKVISCRGIKAELCYSDDPNYTAGYLASKEYGYVRFDYLKEKGNPFGGRIFLYDSKEGNIDEVINYLEREKLIVKDNIKINKTIDYNDFITLGGATFGEEINKSYRE